MKDLIAEYLLVKRASGRAASTLYEYEHYLCSFADHCGKSLGDVVNADVARWIVDEKARRPLAPNSVLARFRAIRTFLNWCVENGHVMQTPLKMNAPRVPKKAPRVASPAALQQLLAQPTETWFDYRDRALLALLLDTGMRIGEACSLGLTHINFAELIVHIPAGKDKEERFAPITQRTADFVTSYVANRPAATTQALLLRRRHPRAAYLPMTVNSAQFMMEKRCKLLKIAPAINLHSIRHLFASTLLNNGMRIESVSKILGHATVEQTLSVYASLSMKTIQLEYNRYWP